jgi:hypothetical protein
MKILRRALMLSALALCAIKTDAQTQIRLSGDSAIRYNPSILDSNTLNSIQFIRGDFVTFDCGIFDKAVFRSNLTQFTTATLQIFDTQNSTNSPLMSATVTNGAGTNNGWNPNCQYTNWSSNSPLSLTNWNFEFNFSDAQTSITLNGQAAQGYWLRLFATTTDATPRIITYLEGPVTVYDGPISSSPSVPSAWFRVGIDVFGNEQPQIYDPVSGHYYNLEVDTIGGIRTLSLGDTPY